ncbi:DUF3833 domain-containing protein [Oxalobacteraceae bacterium]|nr:DUF3833 domain-containing protein [Oxalobacteraceae bacterium]
MKTLLAALALCLAGCASHSVEQYSSELPRLELRSYLNGTIDAWGIFQGRSGEVKKRFHVVIDASWDGNYGTLDERFDWSDGSKSRRVWKLTLQPDGSLRGKADDVVGEALGTLSGNALRWRYVLALPVDGSVYNVDVDDWMFLMDDKIMLNRSYLSKWGINVGEVSLTFRKR